MERRTEAVWRWSAVVCICVVVAAYLAAPASRGLLQEPGELAIIFLAPLFVVLAAAKHSVSRERRFPELLGGLSALVAMVVSVSQRHVLWQGRVLGYATLLFAAAMFVQRMRAMSDAAPNYAKGRLRWYLGVWGLGLLTLGMVAEAWSLTVPARLGGEMQHPPAQGFLIAVVWLPALLAVVRIGWPVARRLTSGGGLYACGQRRFCISRLLLTVVLSTDLGALALRTVGRPALGWVLGLTAGFLASLVWELVVRANVLMRGPGPLVWGFGLLLIGAGVRGALVGAGHPHPTLTGLAAGMLVWLGVWIEWRVVREVSGLQGRGTVVREHPQG